MQGKNIDYNLIRKVRDLVTVLKASPNPKSVVFISPTVILPNELQKDVTILDFDLPTIDEIKGMLDEMIYVNEQSGRIEMDLNESEKEKFVKLHWDLLSRKRKMPLQEPWLRMESLILMILKWF
ncbi:hypothetical protein JTS96_03300 [Clostridium botulinum]|nr:hypothetical protein [Clostridium botulinum]MCS4527071.1 hypothetical protein [Clostridium botulinum]